MLFLCEVKATSGFNTGIVSCMTQGEGVTEYTEPQRHVEIGNWEITFSPTGTSTRAAKLICKHKGGKAPDKMFFVLEDGTLYLKEKQKSVSASFAAKDFTVSFLRKFNIHEIRRADPNRIVDLLTQKPDGTPCYYHTTITDGKVLPRKSQAKCRPVDGRKVQSATWVIVVYKNLNAQDDGAESRFNVLYSMQDHIALMNILDNYKGRKLSQLR